MRLAIPLLLLTVTACRDAAPLAHDRAAEPAPAHTPASTGRSAPEPSSTALRVCADPNNLPFSNDRGEGFENALAELVAAELDMPVEYTWWPQRRGFIRATLRAGVCDVVMGVPHDFELAATTRPYYRSGYVFVTRRDGHLRIRSLDDPRLRRLSIGLHVIGDDYASVPPGDALIARGIVDNLRGYSIYGDYARPNPPADLIAAVDRGEVDVAIAWGPLAGYFAAVTGGALEVVPVAQAPGVPLRFSISMGVRRGDTQLLGRLNEVLERRDADVRALLDRFHVPRLTGGAAPARSDDL
jgi:mxaJ protein